MTETIGLSHKTAEVLLGFKLFDIQLEILNAVFDNDSIFKILATERNKGNSYGLALACLFAAKSEQYKNICVTSPAYRQSKIIYQYLLNILTENNIVYNTKRDAGKCSIQIYNTNIDFMPINIINGYKYDLLFVDEYQSLPKEISLIHVAERIICLSSQF